MIFEPQNAQFLMLRFFFFTILLFLQRRSQKNTIKSSLLEEMIFGQSRLLLFTFVLQMSNVNVNAKGEEDARMEAAAAAFFAIFYFRWFEQNHERNEAQNQMSCIRFAFDSVKGTTLNCDKVTYPFRFCLQHFARNIFIPLRCRK